MLPLLILIAAPETGQSRADNVAAALALHRRLDTNGDGYVTYAEERAVAMAMVVPKGAKVDPAAVPDSRVARAAFDRADLDHDGRISTAEAQAGAARAFDEADTDHDGVLSAAERGAYAARTLTALEVEMATWPALPCRAGAACSTARSVPARQRDPGVAGKRR